MNPKPLYGKNFKLVLYFTLGVIIIISISFIWRLSVLIAHSRYDGRHQFDVLIDTKPMRLVCFSPETSSVSVLIIKNEFETKNIGKDVSVPVDAYLRTDKSSESVAGVLSDSIFHFRNDS